MAGLGWQGKNLLLVNRRVGPRLRLVTVLTDLELEPDGPTTNRCGKCIECVKACPAGALKGTPFGDGYAAREDAYDLAACTKFMEKELNRQPDTADWLCGLCIRSCPYGRGAKPY
jgi:epoxyqueuosine reductase QueG